MGLGYFYKQTTFLRPNHGDSTFKNKNWEIEKSDLPWADVYWAALEKTFRNYQNFDTDRQTQNEKSKVYIADTLDDILDNNETVTNIEQDQLQWYNFFLNIVIIIIVIIQSLMFLKHFSSIWNKNPFLNNGKAWNLDALLWLVWRAIFLPLEKNQLHVNGVFR